MGFVPRCFRAECWFFAGLVFWVEDLVEERRERDFLEPDIRHSGLEVSSVGSFCSGLGLGPFRVLSPPSLLRRSHDDEWLRPIQKGSTTDPFGSFIVETGLLRDVPIRTEALSIRP